MEVTGLFVYGTLREGGSNQHWLARTRPEGRTRAWTPGLLFHLPEAGYPALVLTDPPSYLPPGEGWVAGEYVGYEDEASLQAALADLDPLEDVEGGLYFRTVRPVQLESGLILPAWVYAFPDERLAQLRRDAVALPSGDWSPYLA